MAKELPAVVYQVDITEGPGSPYTLRIVEVTPDEGKSRKFVYEQSSMVDAMRQPIWQPFSDLNDQARTDNYFLAKLVNDYLVTKDPSDTGVPVPAEPAQAV